MPLDEQLISRSNSGQNKADNSESDASDSDNGRNDSASRAGEMRKEQRSGQGGNLLESQGDIRVDKMAALREGGVEGLKDEAIEKALSPVKQETSNLLKTAWESLIDTFGLSLIWIDIHIFLSMVLGKDLFCSLGEEWFPKGTPRNLYGAKKMVGMTEGMAVFGLNLGCLFIILFVLSLIAMIVSGINNPLKLIKAFLGTIWCSVIGGCNKDNSTPDMIISVINTMLDTYL